MHEKYQHLTPSIQYLGLTIKTTNSTMKHSYTGAKSSSPSLRKLFLEKWRIS